MHPERPGFGLTPPPPSPPFSTRTLNTPPTTAPHPPPHRTPPRVQDVDTCWAVHTPIRYYLSSYGTVEAPGEAAMMSEIYARGPITCSMATPEDFDYGACACGVVWGSGVGLYCAGVAWWRVGEPRVRGALWVGGRRLPCPAVSVPAVSAPETFLCGFLRSQSPPLLPAAGYHRGVAVDTSNSTDVDHDVEVVGWGQEEGPGGLK